MAKNEIIVTILADDTVRVETSDFSGPVHMTAEAFILFLEKEHGGKVSRGHAHGHTHAHEHEHEHSGGGGHSHGEKK